MAATITDIGYGYYIPILVIIQVRGVMTMIKFDKLWQTMKEKGITQYALINRYNISPAQITRLKRNESVSTNTIETFCRILECDITDIMELIIEDNNNKND